MTKICNEIIGTTPFFSVFNFLCNGSFWLQNIFFPSTESEALNIYRISARTEDVNEIKALFNNASELELIRILLKEKKYDIEIVFF